MPSAGPRLFLVIGVVLWSRKSLWKQAQPRLEIGMAASKLWTCSLRWTLGRTIGLQPGVMTLVSAIPTLPTSVTLDPAILTLVREMSPVRNDPQVLLPPIRLTKSPVLLGRSCSPTFPLLSPRIRLTMCLTLFPRPLTRDPTLAAMAPFPRSLLVIVLHPPRKLLKFLPSRALSESPILRTGLATVIFQKTD